MFILKNNKLFIMILSLSNVNELFSPAFQFNSHTCYPITLPYYATL